MNSFGGGRSQDLRSRGEAARASTTLQSGETQMECDLDEQHAKKSSFSGHRLLRSEKGGMEGSRFKSVMDRTGGASVEFRPERSVTSEASHSRRTARTDSDSGIAENAAVKRKKSDSLSSFWDDEEDSLPPPDLRRSCEVESAEAGPSSAAMKLERALYEPSDAFKKTCEKDYRLMNQEIVHLTDEKFLLQGRVQMLTFKTMNLEREKSRLQEAVSEILLAREQELLEERKRSEKMERQMRDIILSQEQDLRTRSFRDRLSAGRSSENSQLSVADQLREGQPDQDSVPSRRSSQGLRTKKVTIPSPRCGPRYPKDLLSSPSLRMIYDLRRKAMEEPVKLTSLDLDASESQPSTSADLDNGSFKKPDDVAMTRAKSVLNAAVKVVRQKKREAYEATKSPPLDPEELEEKQHSQQWDATQYFENLHSYSALWAMEPELSEKFWDEHRYYEIMGRAKPEFEEMTYFQYKQRSRKRTKLSEFVFGKEKKTDQIPFVFY